MFSGGGFKSNRMVGDQVYPAFELRNILDFVSCQLGEAQALRLCDEIGVGRTELNHCQFVAVWQVDYAMEYLRGVQQESARVSLSQTAESFPAQRLSPTACNGHNPLSELGARLGLSYRVASLDVLLPHLAHLSSLQDCLQLVINQPRLVGSFTDSLVKLEQDKICVRWLNTGKVNIDKYAFQFEHSICSLMGLARELTGQNVTMRKICFALPECDKPFLQQSTGAEIQFNRPYFEWQIDITALSLPVTYRFDSMVASTLEMPEMSIIDAVLDAIRASFPETMSLEAMAAKMSMSDRNFRRRLAQLGSSYQKLLDQVRCQTAIEHILEGELSVEQIAELMGYTDVSHFRQSFKHWLGYPPGHFLRLNC